MKPVSFSKAVKLTVQNNVSQTAPRTLQCLLWTTHFLGQPGTSKSAMTGELVSSDRQSRGRVAGGKDRVAASKKPGWTRHHQNLTDILSDAHSRQCLFLDFVWGQWRIHTDYSARCQLILAASASTSIIPSVYVGRPFWHNHYLS